MRIKKFSKNKSYSISEKNIFWMKYAINLANLAYLEKEIPIGAVLIKNGRVIGIGWNQCITLKDPTAHAEIIAIREGAKSIKNYRIENSHLYVTIEPCIMCIAAIKQARIKKVFFGAKNKKNSTDMFLKFLKTYKIKKKFQVFNGILEKECSKYIKLFFKNIRKKNY
ncbi:tRNA adenosine(34) deaminase TadA [bacterium endosymbiont of Pedicinus badii]|uniref:tRNA adenosine(34) deaminase TadA n=1 Tax=bacterium endosymbiont of Pedicinus badii TaxID=1719126 RepID=UPI0009BB2451|nr:tRNA adenosine(34) deaminase TadA [bacterium endosymbiont of Pedicinus badii]OQM34491.1 hypothetical protein AOQ89_01220 [bacterium endosymbiont of Pedicinus badii]